MLKSHLNAIESVLLAQSKTATNAGHPNLRGGPREWFIRDFLRNHLPEVLRIGQGEIIDYNSDPNPRPEEYRPQVDIVLYRRDLPIISLSKTDHVFLSEGVMATIEVKSSIRKAGKGGLKQACKATIAHRMLDRQTSMAGMGGGWRPKHIVSYVVSYKGPARMSTVASWLPKICTALDSEPNLLPDMIVILGKGVVWRIDAFPNLEHEDITEDKIWAYVQQSNQNLFTLFVHMLSWMGWISTPPSLDGYFKDLYLEDVEFI